MVFPETVFPDDDLLSTAGLMNRKLANLPTAGVKDGAVAWAADGRKVSEGVGAGTGIPVYFNAATSSWFAFRTDAAAVA